MKIDCIVCSNSMSSYAVSDDTKGFRCRGNTDGHDVIIFAYEDIINYYNAFILNIEIGCNYQNQRTYIYHKNIFLEEIHKVVPYEKSLEFIDRILRIEAFL